MRKERRDGRIYYKTMMYCLCPGCKDMLTKKVSLKTQQSIVKNYNENLNQLNVEYGAGEVFKTDLFLFASSEGNNGEQLNVANVIRLIRLYAVTDYVWEQLAIFGVWIAPSQLMKQFRRSDVVVYDLVQTTRCIIKCSLGYLEKRKTAMIG